jgi:hypothetical protein
LIRLLVLLLITFNNSVLLLTLVWIIKARNICKIKNKQSNINSLWEEIE